GCPRTSRSPGSSSRPGPSPCSSSRSRSPSRGGAAPPEKPPRRGAPRGLAPGVLEVAGLGAFTIGARDGIAVAAVLGSQFAAIATIAAFVLFRERLARVQVVGVVVIAVGVAVLTALQA